MTGSPSPDRRAAAVLAAVTLLALLVRAAGLAGQPFVPDDGAVAMTARNFVERGWATPTMWNHPRLRDLLVYVSLEALGDGAWGLKLWSVLSGVASAPAVALLVLLVTRSLGAAACAGTALAVDPLHVDFSRQAINDVYLSFFPVAAVAAVLRYRDTRSPAWLAAAGALLGLGISSKWSAAFPVGAVAALVAWESIRSSPERGRKVAEVACFAGCLLFIPIAIYLLTFTPWFGRGHDLEEWLRLHAAMGRETATHVGYPGTKLPGNPGEIVSAWRWFLGPTWYVDYVAPPPPATATAGLFVVGIANPLVCLATWPAAGWALWRRWRRGDAGAGWLVLAFLAAYVPFLLVRRPIWPNSAVGVLPFSAALVGWAAARLYERARTAVRLWALAALSAAAVLWLPAAGVSTPITDRAVRALVSPAALDPRNHPLPPRAQ